MQFSITSPGRHQGRHGLDEAKVLVVGEGSVGKTSLIKRLVSGGFSEDESKTEGIDVTKWAVEMDGDPIGLNIWDFGGQEIMHATHQFFLTKRSVYLLVVDARQDEEQNRIEYWLKLIQSFSGHSPVIIVGNKIDQAVLDIDMRGLRSKYPNAIDIRSVSCRNGEGLDDVRWVLTEAIAQLPHVRDALPEPFFDVKARLEAFDRNFLPYGDYIQLCREHSLDVETEQELLVGFLHDLGTVVCFRDDPRLADTHILNPQWVTGGVYRILNAHRAAQRKGLLDWDDINAILDTEAYPSEKRAFIVDMMKKFELCFEADDGAFLIPDLLTKEEPYTGEWEDSLRFEVAYDVLPSSIISRLIVRMSAHITQGTVWRTGVVVALDQNRALVRGDKEDRVVRIAVAGPSNGRRGLLTAIRSELGAIQRAIPGLQSKERVPVPGHPGHWASYDHLLNLEEAGIRDWIPEGLTRAFAVRELLAGVEDTSERSLGRMEMPHQRDPSNPRRRLASQPDDPAAGGRDDMERQGASAEESGKLGPTAADAGGRPLTAAEAVAFGKLLLVAFVAFFATFLVASGVVGTSAAVGLVSAAVSAMVVYGVLVLVSLGRVSEQGLLETLNGFWSRS